MPEHCIDHNTIMYVILLMVVLALLIIVVCSVLFCKYRKLKAGVLATLENDDVIKMGVSFLFFFEFLRKIFFRTV